ncbi:MAG: DUF2298 domain-containing protein [Patescibacteria group bacterium]
MTFLIQTLTWWGSLFLLGLIFLPTTFYFFRDNFDSGYAFSKIIGIASLSFLTWLAGSLYLLPFGRGTIFLLLSFFAALNIVLLQKINISQVRKKIHLLIIEEIIFLLAFISWALIRSYQPKIYGLEKFMDFGFLNAILRTKFFPSKDMWLAGETINYYYFGHLICAVLSKLTNFKSAISYNLMIATIFALSFLESFSFTGNLIHFFCSAQNRKKLSIYFAGLLSALCLTLGGNLQIFWYGLKNKTLKNYWYPTATRFIVQKFGAADNTIHEFPNYSFVVADLHGHLSNIPLVLLFLMISLKSFQTFSQSGTEKVTQKIFASLILGIMLITNPWDFPIYGLFLGLMLLMKKSERIKLHNLAKTVLEGLPYLFGAFLFTLPFYLHFDQIAKGIKLVDKRSPLWQLLFLWGFPLLNFTIFCVSIVVTKIRKRLKLNRGDLFVLLMNSLAIFLIIIPEVVYIKDIYVESHQRANTMFKFTYQAFILFSLTTGYIVTTKIFNKLNKIAVKAVLPFWLFFFFFIAIYPYKAVNSYYNFQDDISLDGTEWMRTKHFGDYQVIQWLNTNQKQKATILEAVGDSYSYYGRISAYTGLPTVLGWPVHEWLWRGSYEAPGERSAEVATIYQTQSPATAKRLLGNYGVDYVIVGQLEREKYKNVQEGKFAILGRKIFSADGTTIYKLE